MRMRMRMHRELADEEAIAAARAAGALRAKGRRAAEARSILLLQQDDAQYYRLADGQGAAGRMCIHWRQHR